MLTRWPFAAAQTVKLQAAIMKVGENINKGAADSGPSAGQDGPSPSDADVRDEPKEEKK